MMLNFGMGAVGQRMREAMFTADVGDDVYGEDPTINKLERIAAELFGKESALFVPTGTMGNSCAIASHCFRGDELICGNRSHIFNYEAGSASTLFGVSMHTIPNHDDGTFSVKDAIQAIRPDDPHFARTRLICVENTHNMCGGRVLPLSFLEDMKRVCKQHNLALHMDGARIANAAAALDIPVYEILSYVDTASICLSKGLGAPVGSILVGPCEFIQKARRVRKLLGGGMRQAGIIAAAGLVALQQNIHRVFIDNDNAKLLAQNLMGIKGICVSPETVETNIVLLSLEKPLDCKQFVKILEKYGVLAGLGYDSSVVRLVTHLKINKPDIEDVSKRIHFALREVLETATHAA